ncbi:probable cytochrome P450 308a1 [Stomoxys calcitrans]|uniref:probable cytochrome P450 308a1 n=1 Tax=Stomoxys calcitrans TaxID=35570 RepID=UPI0027E33CC3|nr:probable cytochrome P450 308a1 [Stomoxys calcitrans]
MEIFFSMLAAICLILFSFLFWKCLYWQRQGIRGPRGWPLVGSMWRFVTGRQHYGDVYERIYNDNPDLSYVGFYRLLGEPVVLLRSLDMIKEVLIRNFNNCQDNVVWVNPQRDPEGFCNPFIAKGPKWRTMRNEVMPIFTPNKVKGSFAHIETVCKKMVKYVDDKMKTNCFEGKELFSKFTLGVIASAAFGLDGQTFEKSDSDFTQLAEDIFKPNPYSLLDTIALLFSPKLGDLIKYRYVPANVATWLRHIVMNILSLRLDEVPLLDKSSNSQRAEQSDFIQWLIENKQKQNEPVDRATIVGHCSTFLLEGFETSSSLMAFALYEYAINPLEQQKVFNELDEVLKRHNGQLCYEALQELCYLEASLYETLRLHPPMMALLKQCTKSFEMPPQSGDGESFLVPEGMIFVVPVKAVHYDNDIYPDPLVFKPQRFMQDKDKLPSCSFLGFGEGPRKCPGGRFGLAQGKAGIASLLSKYSVHLADIVSERPFEISPTTFLTAAQNGIWIKFKERS